MDDCRGTGQILMTLGGITSSPSVLGEYGAVGVADLDDTADSGVRISGFEDGASGI